MTRHRYLQIADYLRELVAAGAPGDRLPAESDLCGRFGVSRMTARQAVQLLVTEGLLYRRPGQGTFIASRLIPRTLGAPLSFTESMRRRGLRASSRLLAADRVPPSPQEVAALRLPGADRPVVVVERVRLGDGVPMAIERAVLAPDLAPVLAADLEGGSLHAAMEALGRVPSRSQARVSARAATARERRLLGQGSSGVVLCEAKVISDQQGVPLEQTETCYAAERYVFDLVLARTGSDALRSEPGRPA